VVASTTSLEHVRSSPVAVGPVRKHADRRYVCLTRIELHKHSTLYAIMNDMDMGGGLPPVVASVNAPVEVPPQEKVQALTPLRTWCLKAVCIWRRHSVCSRRLKHYRLDQWSMLCH
jgi:hypothetical protein